MARPPLRRPTGTSILDRLPGDELGPLIDAATVVSVASRDEVDGLQWEHQPVYFPIGGVYSLLLPMQAESPVEAGVVDSEGMLGIPIVLGMGENPVQAVAHVPGTCVRVPADTFLAVLHGGNTTLDALVRRFLAVSWQTANQTIACNLRHSVRERTDRWLLSVHDRAGADEFAVRQEILSGMIGASRQKVTVVADELQAAGNNRYQRGRVRVLDRPALEAASCECYRVLRKANEFLTS